MTNNYQHTCKKGENAYILNTAPFKSFIKIIKKTKKIIIPFLGEGYYFWEENIEHSHVWGKSRYNNHYNIIEHEDWEIEEKLVFNLLDRKMLMYFDELKKNYIDVNPKFQKWTEAQWIEYLKKERKGFPFEYIRAEENFPKHLELKNNVRYSKFVEHSDILMNMNPIYVLCVINKSSLKGYKKKSIIH